MSKYLDISRRRFLKASAVSGPGMALGLTLLPGAKPFANVLDDNAKDSVQANLFVALRPDGIVEITCHRSEMGQQIRTAVAQIVADEMDADWEQIKVIQAPGDPAYGDQNTDGSKSISTNLMRLRQMGASARAMLIQAAAKQWGVDPSACTTELHRVVHTSGKTLGFGELAIHAGKETPPEAASLAMKSPAEWRYIGKGPAAVDLSHLISGQATFAADVRLPDTKVAVIVRPPAPLAKVKTFDDTQARKVPGVIDILTLPAPAQPLMFQPLGGIAVVAENTWAAIKASKLLDVEWDNGPYSDYDSTEYKQQLLAAARNPGKVRFATGDADAAISESTTQITAEYYVPHLSQAPMEPPAATARFADGKLEVWSATQNPQADVATIAAILGMDKSAITVHVTLLGGGFGRKSKPDFAVEAAYLAKQLDTPIRVQWTREDDIQHSFYHAASAQKLEAGLDINGKLTAFKHRTAFSLQAPLFIPGATEPLPHELVLGFHQTPFATDNIQMESGFAPTKTRVGWMRSVHNIFHAFAVQSFAGELAHAAGRDQKDYLLELIGPDRVINLAERGPEFPMYKAIEQAYPYETGRLRNVTERAAAMAGWGRKLPKGHGLGIAVHSSFLSYVATVVEVEVNASGDLYVVKTWVAIDAGIVVNTDSVKAQCMGGSIYSLSYALDGQITMKDGAVEQSNFHDYPVARMADAPAEIDVEVIPSTSLPGGVGEPPTPPFAPALCNAIFAACGKRIRELPIGDQLKA